MIFRVGRHPHSKWIMMLELLMWTVTIGQKRLCPAPEPDSEIIDCSPPMLSPCVPSDSCDDESSHDISFSLSHPTPESINESDTSF